MDRPARATPEEAERYLDASLEARLDLEVMRAELDAARARLAKIEPLVDTVVRAAAVDGDTAGVTTCLAIRQMRDTYAALDAVPAAEAGSARTYDQLTEQEGGPPNERINEKPITR
jgi:hypothetical protein